VNASNTIDLWPLLLYSVIVVVLICGLLVLSALLGEKTKGHATQDVYESGVEGVGSAQFRMSVPFYLTAILFIIFDLEAAFLFAWAISIREAGWLGYIEVSIFIFILLAGLLYLWRSGALEWRTKRQQHDKAALIGEGGVVNGAKARKVKVSHGHDHDNHSHDGSHSQDGHDHSHSSGAHH
jgi:NADH-quinone oxidoreductase subunit A